MSRQSRPSWPTMLAHWASNLHSVGLHSSIVMTRKYHAVLYFRSSDRVKRVNPMHRVTTRPQPLSELCALKRTVGYLLVFPKDLRRKLNSMEWWGWIKISGPFMPNSFPDFWSHCQHITLHASCGGSLRKFTSVWVMDLSALEMLASITGFTLFCFQYEECNDAETIGPYEVNSNLSVK